MIDRDLVEAVPSLPGIINSTLLPEKNEARHRSFARELIMLIEEEPDMFEETILKVIKQLQIVEPDHWVDVLIKRMPHSARHMSDHPALS